MSAVCSPDVEDKIVEIRKDLHEFLYVFGDGKMAPIKLKMIRDKLNNIIEGLENGTLR